MVVFDLQDEKGNNCLLQCWVSGQFIQFPQPTGAETGTQRDDEVTSDPFSSRFGGSHIRIIGYTCPTPKSVPLVLGSPIFWC